MAENRLAREKSPYLLQHAHNPVDWYAWGEEAFERARAEDRPVFLSIGYATCHWCHVMERESFEDPEVARLLNEGFVSIKVDREERPDIDSVYMTVCQLMTGHGGWPLTVFLTPERKPFFAGTYFPRESRGGRMGMLDLLPRLRSLWQERREEVESSAGAALSAVAESEARALEAGRGIALSRDTLARAYKELSDRYDPHMGGFGRAPKFPTPHQLLFLLRWHDRTGEEAPLDMVRTTLAMMRRGGIFDHVGFGFHRYSTDARWLVPHFEKMLYDQALISLACVETWQITREASFRAIAEEVFAYVLRDLRDETGAFHSAEDADSEAPDGTHREGAFYVWTKEELDEVLASSLGPEAAALAREAFGVKAAGNFAEEASGRLTGENILHLREPLPAIAARHRMEPAALEERLEEIRRVLFEARERRPRPLLDDKVLADWNGLMIAALAAAGRAFGEPEYVDAAGEAARFVLGEMRDAEGRLLHRYREGEAGIPAGGADHAYLAWGVLELYEATYEPGWLEEARGLLDDLAERFWDMDGGGFYTSADDVEDVPVRQKETYDGATPSVNAVAWYALLRFGRLTGDAAVLERADRLAEALGGAVARSPSAHTMWMVALDLSLGPAHEVVIAGDPQAPDTRRLLEPLERRFLPRTSVLLRDPDPDVARRLEEIAPFTAGHDPVEGAAAAYVCTDFACQRPTTDPEEMLELLS